MSQEFPIINNFNFSKIENYHGETPPACTWRNYGFKRIDGGHIKFYADFVCCPCIYYIKEGANFCYGFDVKSVVDFANNHGIKIGETFKGAETINNNVKQHIKKSVLERYRYDVNYIENWQGVVIDSHGNFTVEKNTFIPFTIDVETHYNELKEFLLKYKRYISKLIDEGKFIPTITGGLDTRYLLGLFREKARQVPGYYSKAVKPDGKKDVVKGELELKLAVTVAKKFGISEFRYETLPPQTYTMSGMFNENANTYDNPNDPQYIYKVIQHGWSNKNHYNNIAPFTDELYLRFKQDGEFMRILLALLLTPDLIYIPLVSGTSLYNYYPQGYSFTQLQQLNDVIKLLKTWGEDKIKNILKDD